MYFKFNCIFILLLVFNFSFSQNDETLLTIDDEPVSTSEFLKLYNKNIDLVKDDSQKEIDNYLDLFINYKLKLKEAKRLGFDQDANYLKEFENYKNQLTKNYLSDNKVTDALVAEAYERSSFDVKASHILIFDNPEVEDTLVAYNKLLDYRKTLKNEGFEAAKQKYHDGKTVVVEDLGYFSAFKMVYGFESMAFNTEPGNVSMPFKTQFGYHVVRVDDKRPSRGTATAAHIMVALKQNDTTINPEIRINEIYKKIQQGTSFEALAKQFSDDKSSAKNGGALRPFKSGQLSSIDFENAVFNIKNNGDIIAPIKTEYGWHIIKLIDKKPLEDFETLKPQLENQVKRDSRSKLINSVMVKELSQRYTIDKNPKTNFVFNTIINDSYFAGKFELPADYNGKTAVITVNNFVFTNNDFVQFLKSKQRQYMRQKVSVNKLLDTELPLFYEQSILKFREDNLINENEEFADILKEYRDGLLLFELMENEIWNKASKDTLGLETYYDANTSKYVWEDRVDIIMATTSSKDIAEKVVALLKSQKTQNEIKEILNTKSEQNVIFTSGVFEVSNPVLPRSLKQTLGVSKIYNHNEAYHVIDIKNSLPSTVKTIEEAKGMVVADYQNELETKWLKDLKSRYRVKVDRKVLQNIKSLINK